MDGQPRRLDSWKEIADYLGRDVRTAMRWAKSQQLPVRRVGGQGRSVFAFTDEIDAWLAGRPAAAPDPPPAALAEADAAAPTRRGLRFPAYAIAIVTLAVLVIIIGPRPGWSARPGAGGLPVRVEVDEWTVSLTDGTRRRELHRFDPDVTPTLTPATPRFHDADGDGTRDVLVGISTYVDHHHRAPRTGELINVSHDGETDTATFSGIEVKPPALTAEGESSWFTQLVIGGVFMLVIVLLFGLVYFVWRFAAGPGVNEEALSA